MASWCDFAHLVTTTRTHDVYKGLPLSNMTPSHRGTVLENVARECDRRFCNKNISDATETVGLTGKKRALRCEEYDFKRGNIRVEVKSAQLTWDSAREVWGFVFLAIKVDKHDELQLVMYAPDGIYIWKNPAHNGRNGRIMYLQDPGPVRTGCNYGKNFRIYAAHGVHDAHDAMRCILKKMSGTLFMHIRW